MCVTVKFHLRTLLGVVTLFALLFTLYANRDAIPGTYHKDDRGLSHGTGEAQYFYDNGALMIREWYYRGLIYRSTWFTPDGREIATETFDIKSGGVGYDLRQDGTIRSKFTSKYVPAENVYGNAEFPVYDDATGSPAPNAKDPID